jgi:DNA polymerase-1
MNKLMMPLNWVLMETEYNGVQVDIPTIDALKIKFGNDIDRLKKNIFAKVGYELNLNSPKQLIKLLFEDLKFKPIKYNLKTRAISTDKSVLKILAKKHDVPKLLLEFRKVDKLFSTYINKVNYDSNTRVHTNYSMHVTNTGRLASSGPNLQNIPRDSEIKNMFVAKSGHVFVQMDFAQVEFRLWAHESNDTKMLNDIAAGLDIHRQTASEAYGIPPEQITKEQRNIAKNLTFGVMYGRGAKSVAEQYNIPESQAKEIIEKFFRKYPVASRWIQSIVLVARQQGYLTNFFGRKRRLVGLQNPDQEKQAMAERQAKNFLMQSGAADLTNWLSIRLRPLLNPYDTQLVLNVHDSLVYEVPECHLHQVVEIINAEANRPIGGIRVKLAAEVQVGKKWGDLTSPEKYYEEEEEDDEA